MSFKKYYVRAEKRALLSKRVLFARCNVTFWVRGRTGMLTMRVSIPGKRYTDRSMGIKLKRGQLNYKTYEVADNPTLTTRLADLRASVMKVFTEREITDRSLEPKVIADIAFGLRGHDDLIPGISEALDRWLDQKEQNIGPGFTLSSFKQYTRYANIIQEFCDAQYGKNASLDVLKPAVHYELMAYMKSKRKYCHNYSIKVIRFLKAILDYGVSYEWVDRNVLGSVRMNRQKKAVINLDMGDVEKIQKMELGDGSLSEVRDVFLFCVYSGLAYTDVKSLTPDHIITVDGVQCVLKDRQKTGQQSFVPLFPEAIALLNKYSDHRICRIRGVCLPVLSNVKMNIYLKVLGAAAQVKETLHTHLARKTFSMYAEERGFKLEQTSIMLGHASLSMTTQHYYKQRRETVIKAFKDIQRNDGNDLSQQAG